MTGIKRKKCCSCKELFIPDPRNAKRQKYCRKSECRKASKAASQKRWLQKPENQGYFSGAENVTRVQLWRKAKVKRFGFHSILHLTASILYNLGYEVAIMQTILSHKSPNTTERYLKTHGIEKVRDALEDLSRTNGKILPFPSNKVENGKNENKKAVRGAVTSPNGNKKVL